MQINLISDTVTKPGKDMLKSMMDAKVGDDVFKEDPTCLLYTSPSPRDRTRSRMPSSA